MRKMSMARTIKIQKLQTKNRMVGKTFNPGGHTSESLSGREKQEIERINNLVQCDFILLGSQYKALADFKEENNHHYSNSFEQNVFLRNFNAKFLTLIKMITSDLVIDKEYRVLTINPSIWNTSIYIGMQKATLKTRELYNFKGARGVYSVLLQDLPTRVKNI